VERVLCVGTDDVHDGMEEVLADLGDTMSEFSRSNGDGWFYDDEAGVLELGMHLVDETDN
jgi:hypothetical protein